MPGICGFFGTAPAADSPQLLDDMLARLHVSTAPFTGRHIEPDGRCGLGSVSLGIIGTLSQPIVSGDGRLLAVIDGEIEEQAPAPASSFHNGQPADERDLANSLGVRYSREGAKVVADWEGSFAAAAINLDSATLRLVSDRFGTRPLYYAHTFRRFCFASSISALLADPDVSRELDRAGVSQFFTFGHYFGDHTSLSAVKVLPAGAVLTYDGRANRVTIDRYWSGDDRIAARPATRREAYEAVEHALVRSVRRTHGRPQTNVGISLSGGLDARTLLGLYDHSQQPITSVCMGMAGSKEHKASQELARIVGCKHHCHVLDTRFLGNFRRHLEHMVRLTDGQYLSQCIVMPTLPMYRDLGIGVLLRGHGGELLHMTKAYNYSLNAEALTLNNDSELESWLWRRLQAYLRDGVEGPLFARRELEGTEAARESLRSALAAIPNSASHSQRVAHLFLDQRVRRETMLSMMKFRSVVEPRMPYLDRALVEMLLALPTEWKLADELQNHVLRNHQPRFCQVANTNTGTRLGAGKIRRSVASLRMTTFAKLGVPGYQPYERLGLWLRRELADCVEDILLSEACLDRGIFTPDTVRTVVRKHLSAQRNHTYLIMAMMVFEVGHRWLLDGDRAHPSTSSSVLNHAV